MAATDIDALREYMAGAAPVEESARRLGVRAEHGANGGRWRWHAVGSAMWGAMLFDTEQAALAAGLACLIDLGMDAAQDVRDPCSSLAASVRSADGGGVGSTVISWRMPGDIVGQVWVSADGDDERLVAEGVGGWQAIPWIRAGSRYLFALYAGTARGGSPLRAVVVSGGVG